jgi:hypothetical protein
MTAINIITKLRIDEISFCARPANPQAAIVIAKRDALEDGRLGPEPEMVFKATIGAPVRPVAGPSSTIMVDHYESNESNEDTMTAFAKAESDLDALVAKRMATTDEDEAHAMTAVLATTPGKQAYAKMAYARDVEVAKQSTLLCSGAQQVTKVGSHGADVRSAATRAADQLDTLARSYAKEHGVGFHAAYASIIGTPEGKALYAQVCGAPSAARTVA